MDDEIDHLKAFKSVEAEPLSSDHVLLTGLDMARAHQRGQQVGRLERRARQRPWIVPAETRQAIRAAEGLHGQIAKAFNVSRRTVDNIKAEDHAK